MFSLSNLLKSSIIQPSRVLFSQKQNLGAISTVRDFSKNVEEKVELPIKPKKPLTPYFRFLRENRPQFTKLNPKLAIPDVIRQLAKMWETTDEQIKTKYAADFKKDQIKYVEDRAKYDSKLTDEQKDEIRMMKQEVIESKEKRALRKKIRDLDRPKKPASAFLRFLGEERVNNPQGTLSYREWQLKAAAKWNALSDGQKNNYVNAFKSEIESYKQHLAKWELKMVKQGHVDVVRNEALIEPVTKARKAKYGTE